MERRRHSAIATFFTDASLVTGSTVTLSEDVAQHARVRRIAAGDAIRLTNGRGALALAVLGRVAKGHAEARVDEVEQVPRAAPLRLLVPVADRERMLWLAEKSAELGITAWQPVMFERSASVSPRGEGEKFAQKVRARMISALEQSGGAWLPEIAAELSLPDALVRADEVEAKRYLLERGGEPLLAERPRAADVLIGPEGGVADEERLLIIERHGWLPVSVGETTLRFETASIVAAGVLRALLARP